MGEALLPALSTREETICKVQCMQPSTVQDHAGGGSLNPINSLHREAHFCGTWFYIVKDASNDIHDVSMNKFAAFVKTGEVIYVWFSQDQFDSKRTKQVSDLSTASGVRRDWQVLGSARRRPWL